MPPVFVAPADAAAVETSRRVGDAVVAAEAAAAVGLVRADSRARHLFTSER
jgi:N-methylhydantoinase B/oxoprolinase/acetone carboxylase alpha subunit